MSDELTKRSLPLKNFSDLYSLFQRIDDSSYVLIGEASRGTSEFYKWRAEISKWLILNKGFSFVAVEGDWPDCYRINRYVKGYSNPGRNARAVLQTFNRWPTWLWANEEVAEFVEWLKKFNEGLPTDRQVGFYGLDVYSLWDSLNEVVNYLKRVHPEAAKEARRAYKCFEPFSQDVEHYALTTSFVPESCEDEVVQMLLGLRRELVEFPQSDREFNFNLEQNALTVVNGEKYYRSMLKGDEISWNVRDQAMTQTFERLLNFYGEPTKAIIWAHNTHIGDARFTDMKDTGMINLGQLVRQKQGQDSTFLICFSSYQGRVIASNEWDGSMKKMEVPLAEKDSWEDILHRLSHEDKLLLLTELFINDELKKSRGLRAIGVVYNPKHESGNYIPTILPSCFDALLYLDNTTALHPFKVKIVRNKDFPETFPTAV